MFIGEVVNKGCQTSPTVVSLKGRLPQVLQSNSTLSFEIIQIHSLFRHGFKKKQKPEFSPHKKDLDIDLRDSELWGICTE